MITNYGDKLEGHSRYTFRIYEQDIECNVEEIQEYKARIARLEKEILRRLEFNKEILRNVLKKGWEFAYEKEISDYINGNDGNNVSHDLYSIV